jgi:membrane fusion protein, multidrug efflux system
VRWLVSAVMVVAGVALAEQAQAKLKVVKATEVRTSGREAGTGSLFPSKMLPVGFEVGGRLVLSKVQRGEVVKAGQLLGALDQEIIDAQVAQAEAGLAAAEAGAALAADVAGRNEKLKAEGSVSDVQNRQADTQAKAAMAQVQQAKAGLAQARAGKRRHAVAATFSGTVIDAPDQVGGMVGPGAPVYIVQQLDPLILKTTITEGMRGHVKAGLKVKVESVGGSASTTDAVVKVVINSADPQSRRVPVEIVVPNVDGRFVANTLARVYFPASQERVAYTIPATALGSTGGEHVYAVDDAGAARRVSVQVVERNPKEVTVVPTEPLTNVVDYPTAGLVDGTKVTQR